MIKQLSKEQKNHLLSPKYGVEALSGYKLTCASEISIRSCLELLWRVQEAKERIMRRMLLTDECYRWMEDELFERKLRLYEKDLENIKMEKKAA